MVNNPIMSKTATLVIKIIMRKEMFRMTKMVMAMLVIMMLMM